MLQPFGCTCGRRDSPPTPTNISSKLDPLANKNGTSASPATALANIVFPVPGGPVKRTPFGNLPPRVENFSGFFRNSTISSSSYRHHQPQDRYFNKRRGKTHALSLFYSMDIRELHHLPFLRLKLHWTRTSFEQTSILHHHREDGENDESPDTDAKQPSDRFPGINLRCRWSHLDVDWGKRGTGC